MEIQAPDSTIKGIIFDMDNTLVDFMKMKWSAIDAAIVGMIDSGLKIDFETARDKVFAIYNTKGIEYQRVFDEFLENELGQIDYKIWAAGIVAYRRSREATLVAYPHVHMTLLELAKRGFQLVVVSDAPRREAWLRVAYLQLQHVFHDVICFEDTGERKPNPAPFLKALESLQMTPEQVLMIGDWPERDVVGAKTLGIRTVFARYGDTFGVQESGADYEINDIIEVLDIVSEINHTTAKEG